MVMGNSFHAEGSKWHGAGAQLWLIEKSVTCSSFMHSSYVTVPRHLCFLSCEWYLLNFVPDDTIFKYLS